MSLEKAIRNLLINDETVSGIVYTRVYADHRPQGTSLPAITYQNIFTKENEALATQAGIRRTRFSIEVFSTAYGANKTLRDAVETALINYTGTVELEVISSMRLESSTDLGLLKTPGSDSGVWRTILDFIIWHQ